ncbi:MAG: DUF2935 domain-containing protein [Dehalobacterium sp.]
MSKRISNRDFVRLSLELHLFFLRIMKEHSFFLAAGFLPKDEGLALRANNFNEQFNDLLHQAVTMANCHVSRTVLQSGEVVTDKTLRAEQKTSELSGVDFDTNLTRRELQLKAGDPDPRLVCEVFDFNNRVITKTRDLIQFKTFVLNNMLQCRLFTYNFPLLIDHIRREAFFYIDHLQQLQRRQPMNITRQIFDEKAFWDRIMKEHAQFIAHLLDPTEVELIESAEDFADLFKELQKQVQHLEQKGICRSGRIQRIVNEEIDATRSIRDFKAEATDLLLACQVKSLIIPLLGDHVLREANHFLRILKFPLSLK